MNPSPRLDHVLRVECLVCGRGYDDADLDDTVRHHGMVGTLDVVYDYELIGTRFTQSGLREDDDRTIWRYRPLLPVSAAAPVPHLAIGWTPLYRLPWLAASIGVAELWVKDDGLQPTASFKDRPSAVAVVRAGERRADVVTTASTGNAAAALAGMAASVGMPCVIFVPETAPEAKLSQVLNFGAVVMLVEGSYDEAFDLCVTVAGRMDWYSRNTGLNPFVTEGKKTAMLEIYEQLGGEMPDVVIVSVGDGSIIGGLHKGLRDLEALGWIDHMPRLIGVQAEGSRYLVDAFVEGEDVLTKPAAPADTIADSISAGLPRDRLKAMRAVRATDGAFLAVSDGAILAAIPALAQGAGVFAEPAAAAAYAGLLVAVDQGVVGPDDRVVVMSTGNGLKDVPTAIRAAQTAGIRALPVAADIDDVTEILQRLPSLGGTTTSAAAGAAGWQRAQA